MNIALVHDWLNQLGGAEDVLVTLKRLFPDAPIFTSIYARQLMPATWRAWAIHSSWMDRLPGVHRYHQPYMPLFAWTWAHYRIPAQHDVVLSNKSAFCIGAQLVHPNAIHICYCLTPTRFTYDFEAYAQRERIPPSAKAILRGMNVYLRRWETRAAQRVTHIIAISREVQARIRRWYGREAPIIFPPVALPPQMPTPQDDGFYLIVSRLLPYKRVDLAIEAFARLKLPLLIAGDGRDRPHLERLVEARNAHNVRLLGRVDEGTLHDLLRRCRAFVFPGHEDFGIAPVRAMGYGKPVIAFAAGGALDTVKEGVSGTLFTSQTVDALVDAVQRHNRVTFAPSVIRAHAEQFSEHRFAEQITEFVMRCV